MAAVGVQHALRFDFEHSMTSIKGREIIIFFDEFHLRVPLFGLISSKTALYLITIKQARPRESIERKRVRERN